MALPPQRRAAWTLEPDRLVQDPGSASTLYMIWGKLKTFLCLYVVIYKMGISTLLAFVGMK